MTRVRMTRPSPTSLVAFVLVVAVAAAAALGLGLGTDGATAIQVGDTKISRAAVNDELRVLAELGSGQLKSGKGAVTAETGAAIATQLVFAELAQRYLTRVGERVTAEDRASAREGADGPELRSTPAWFQTRYLRRLSILAAMTRLAEQDPDAVRRVLTREAERAGVRIDAAYGEWVPQTVQVVPVQVSPGLVDGS